MLELYEQRREQAEQEFHKKLKEFMRKYKIPNNELNQIGIIGWIDVIESKRNEMIYWNELKNEEQRR